MRPGHSFLWTVVATAVLCWAQPAFADNPDLDAGDMAPVGQTSPDNPEAEGVPLACDGSLCDTTNSSTISSCSVGGPVGLAGPLLGVLFARGIVARRRRRAGTPSR